MENIINKDLASAIKKSLFGADELGQRQPDTFVEKCLCKAPGIDELVDFKAPTHKNKALTFALLFNIVEYTKGK